MTVLRWFLVGVVMLVAAGCGGDDADLFQQDASEAVAQYSYTIPPGAGEALDRGEPLEILPGRLDVVIGEVIEIVNEDDRGHLVGPFYVGAGEVLRQRFSAEGEFIGVCTVHPSGELVLNVRAS